jgi:hypothetical protein
MGLDIYFNKITTDVSDVNELVLEPGEDSTSIIALFEHFKQYQVIKPIEMINWEKTFASLNLTSTDYEWCMTQFGPDAVYTFSNKNKEYVHINHNELICDIIECPVLHYTEHGYIRKGMNDKFYSNFLKNGLDYDRSSEFNYYTYKKSDIDDWYLPNLDQYERNAGRLTEWRVNWDEFSFIHNSW